PRAELQDIGLARISQEVTATRAGPARTGKARTDLSSLASRSQIKHGYGSHRQQPQNDNRSDVLDPFLIVREPSMMHVHGQPPSGYPCSKLTYHNYGSMTAPGPRASPLQAQRSRNALIWP